MLKYHIYCLLKGIVNMQDCLNVCFLYAPISGAEISHLLSP